MLMYPQYFQTWFSIGLILALCLPNISVISVPSILKKTLGRNDLNFGTYMYHDHIQNWWDFRPILALSWQFKKKNEIGVSGIPMRTHGNKKKWKYDAEKAETLFTIIIWTQFIYPHLSLTGEFGESLRLHLKKVTAKYRKCDVRRNTVFILKRILLQIYPRKRKQHVPYCDLACWAGSDGDHSIGLVYRRGIWGRILCRRKWFLYIYRR